MSEIDVLIVTALKEEHEAARDAALAACAGGNGVAVWENRDTATATPYLFGKYVADTNVSINGTHLRYRPIAAPAFAGIGRRLCRAG